MGKNADKMPSDILDRLKSVMVRRSIKGAPQLAHATGAKPVTVRTWINGTRSPSLETCMKIGPPLGVSGEWLYYGRGEMDVPVERPKALDATNVSELIFTAVEQVVLMIEAHLKCGINVETAGEIAEAVQLAVMNLKVPRGMTPDDALRRVLRFELTDLLLKPR